jgi:hypothetical protein
MLWEAMGPQCAANRLALVHAVAGLDRLEARGELRVDMEVGYTTATISGLTISKAFRIPASFALNTPPRLSFFRAALGPRR